MDPTLAPSNRGLNALVPLAAPLIVAAIVAIGLIWLSIANLDGSVAARQVKPAHSSAIHRLFFREVRS